MNTFKKESKNPLVICILIIFIALSYIKFFTLQVSFSNDPTVSIVKTQDIQWGSNTCRIDNESLPYNWYEEYGFKILYADEMGHKWQSIHSSIIFLWWFMLIYIGFSLIKSISKIYIKKN